MRVLDQAPPPATVSWLDYRELWLQSLPVYLLVSAAIMLAVAAARGGRSQVKWLPATGALAVLVLPLFAGLPATDPGGDDAALSAAGSAQIELGGWYSATSLAGMLDSGSTLKTVARG